jgi:hypothetical protein
METWWIQSAVLAAHVQLEDKGLRQKDVRFMLELLGSWRWAADERRLKTPLHNTQILRHLRELTELGWIKQLGRQKPPRYRLSRAGLVGVLEGLRQTALQSEFSTYWFLSFVLQAYKERLLRLIEKEGSNLPLPQRMDVERILDGKSLIKERRQLIKDRLAYWQRRIQENEAIIELVERRLREKITLEEVVAEIERRHPYELNLTKPITTFISEIPHDLKVWELTEGQRRRAKMVWQSFAKNLELELRMLE